MKINRLGFNGKTFTRLVSLALLVPVWMGAQVQADPVTTPSGLFVVNGNTVTTGTATGTFSGVTVSNATATTLTLGQTNGATLELDNATNSNEFDLGNGSAVTVQMGTTVKNTVSNAAISLGSGTVNSSGVIFGYTDGISTVGTGTITNSGQIYGGNDTSIPTSGETAVVLGTGGTVNNVGTASFILGYVNGISILGAGTVNNQGEIGGFTNGGVVINGIGTVTNSGTIAGGGNDAVHIAGTADVTNSGTLDGVINGVEGFSSGTVTNSGKIYGVNDTGTPTAGGAGVFFHGNGTVINQGASSLIEGYTQGVFIAGTGSVTNNSGSIIGLSDGIDMGAGTVVNAEGIIEGGTENGINIGGNGTVINNSGSAGGGNIFGGNDGIMITGTGNVTNTGTIFGVNDPNTPTSGNDGVELAGGGTITNKGSGLIEGYVNGIEIDGQGTVNNQGSIAGQTNGIVINGSGTVTSVGAEIEIVGETGNGITIATNGSVTNTGSGTIGGAINGIEIDGSGTVTNTGMIYGLDNPKAPTAGNDGVLLGFGSVTNSSTGLIAGYANAIEIDNNGTVNNAGEIAGNTNAILLGGAGTLTVINSGEILAIQIGVSAFTTNNALVLTNSGSITGANYAIFDESGTITKLINTGSITSPDSSIGAGAIDSLINTGTIGEFATGVGIYSKGVGHIELDGGSVYGAATAIALDGADSLATNLSTITINGRAHVSGLMLDGDTSAPGTLILNLVGLTPAQLAALQTESALLDGSFTVGANTYIWSNFKVIDQSISLELAVDPGLRDLAAKIDNAEQGLPGAYDPLYVAAGTNPEAALESLSGREFDDAFAQIGLSNSANFAELADGRAFDLRAGTGGFDLSGLSITSSSLIADLGQTNDILGKMMSSSIFSGTVMSDSKETTPASTSPRWGAWLSGTVTLADASTTWSAPGFHSDTESPTLGVDYRVTHDLALGALVNYSNTGAHFGDGSQLNVQNELLGLYGVWSHDSWYVNGLVGGGLAQYDDHRATLTGAQAQSSPNGDQIMANLTGGYDFKLGHDWRISPEAGLQYTHLEQDAFQETGAGAYNLNVADQKVDSLRTKLGFRLTDNFTWDGIKFTPQFHAAWYHECLDDSRGVSTSLPGAPALGSFVVGTNAPERDYALVGTGLSATPNELGGNVTFFLNYDAQVGQSNFIAHTFNGGLRIGF